MKHLSPLLIVAGMALFSCKKSNTFLEESSCQTFNISGEVETVVKYQGCNSVFYTTAFNNPGTVEGKEGTIQIFKLRYTLQLENNSSVPVKFCDDFNTTMINSDNSQTIKSTGLYTLLYDSDKITNQYAILYLNDLRTETRKLTDGSTKFFTPLTGSNIKIIITNGETLNNN